MTIAAPLATLLVLLALARIGRPRARHFEPVAEPRRQISGLSQRVRVGVTAVVGLAIGVVAVGPFLVAVVATVAIAWPRTRHIASQRRRRRQVDRDLPTAIEMLVLVIRAGMTPHQAVLVLQQRAPASIKPAFAEVHRRTARGVPLADALGALPEILGDGASIVADTLAIAERHGTPIGAALDQLAADVHERRRRAAEADARRLPIRMSFPLVACTLPSFVLLAIVPAVLAAVRSLDTTGF